MTHRDDVLALVHAHADSHRNATRPPDHLAGPLRVAGLGWVERTRQHVEEGLLLGPRTAEVAVTGLPTEQELEDAAAAGRPVVVGVDLQLRSGPNGAAAGSVAEGVPGLRPVRPVVRVVLESRQTAMSVAHTPHGWRAVDLQEEGAWFSERVCTHPTADLHVRRPLFRKPVGDAASRAGLGVEADYVFVQPGGRRSYGLRLSSRRSTEAVVTLGVLHEVPPAGWLVPAHHMVLVDSPAASEADLTTTLRVTDTGGGTPVDVLLRLVTPEGHPRLGWCG